MRVKISYGTHINSVPRIAKQLLIETIKELQSSITKLNNTLDEFDDQEVNFLLCASLIDKSRTKLTDVDSSLIDIQSILQGLDTHYNGEENVSERRSAVDTSRSNATQTKDSGEG